MQIKKHLDQLVEQYNKAEFSLNDPIQCPQQFERLQDIEIVAFLVSTITWGRRKMILNSADKMLQEMNFKPLDYIQRGHFRDGNESLHRTFMWDDFAEICSSLALYYSGNTSLEDLFLDEGGKLSMLKYKSSFPNRRISNWEKGSASKRIHMFLRWMVRQDGIVDIGCWKRIDQANLFIPLDTHVIRNAREFGLLKRKCNDRKAVEELTGHLREFCPEDPIKYDFALFAMTVT